MAANETLSKIGIYRKSGSILELGPGGGYFLSQARNLGYEPYGIELNPIEQQWISENLHIPCENVALNEKSFGGRQFDIVYHKDVLSHLSDPIEVFRHINKVLKNSGLLVFETGNIADVNEKYYKWFSQFSYPDHLFFFGERSLKMLLDQTGFRCTRIYRDNIMLQLLVQKALWGAKDSLKDENVVDEMKLRRRDLDPGSSRISLKRRIRLLYRYAQHYLVKYSAVLPKEGRPLKLLVVAEKRAATSA